MESVTTLATLPPSKRARILDYLHEHPDRTAYEITVALGEWRQSGRGAHSEIFRLLRSMERKAQVVATTEFRPRQGRRVHLWRVAPPGTVPPPGVPPQAAAERQRERARLSKRRERARSRGLAVSPGTYIGATRPRLPMAIGWALLPGAACRDADPRLFFPESGESDTEAKAICAACPVRAGCLAGALTNRERYGVWGGVNLEAREHYAGGVR